MSYLSEADHKIVTDAVAAAEDRTSGEIVTVLADRSDGYTDVALAWAIGAALLALIAFAAFPDPLLSAVDGLTGDWNTDWTPRGVATVAALLTTAGFALVLGLQMIDAVRFALVPGRIRTTRVIERAIAHFKTGAERRTHGRTGVLIYLSMREHRAEIVADEPIAAKVSPEIWGEAMYDMLDHIAAGRIAEGMAAGVRDVGDVLAEHFPRAEDDVNELPDRLIEI